MGLEIAEITNGEQVPGLARFSVNECATPGLGVQQFRVVRLDRRITAHNPVAGGLSPGVQAVLSYVAETGGEAALARIREAHTDAFEIRSFRKDACRSSEDRGGHICAFAVEIDTVTGPIEQSIAGRFYVGPCGLVYDHDA